MSFNLTARQQEAQKVCAGPATHCMLFGGSRSGKTFLLVRNVVMRALKAPRSRHGIFRYRFNHLRASVVLDTFPKVMQLAFPGVEYQSRTQDGYAELPGGSQVWFAGLDDKARTEKILGMEFCTLYFNECSQIPQTSVDTALTRLAQRAEVKMDGAEPSLLRLRAYYDCVAGDTVLDGHTATIAQLAATGAPIRVLTSRGWAVASAPWRNGRGALLKIVTDAGRGLTVTPSHRFWVEGAGWTRAEHLTIGKRLLCTDESRFPDGALNALHESQRLQGSPGSCCKCPRQRDAQPRQQPAVGPTCLASSFDEGPHNRDEARRASQDFHTGHPDLQAVQRSRRTPGFLASLWQLFASSLLHKTRLAGQAASELSQQIPRSGWQSPALAYLALPVQERFSEDRHSCFREERCEVRDQQLGANGTRSQPSSLPFGLSQDRQDLDPKADEESTCQTVACDTPDEELCWYETVDCIVLQPAADYYTVEVPSVLHYVAHGFVSHNCNPPSKAHWTYRRFVEKRDPETRIGLPHPDDYASIQINPGDNRDNLNPQYLAQLEALPARMRARFLEGRFADATPNALFDEANIDRWRVLDGAVPDMVRVVVAVDPSGAGDDASADQDAIGIVVVGLGTDGAAYVLEDCTVKAGPATWGKVATSAFDRHKADVVVAETNFGGAMVSQVIQSARARTPFRAVTASRGKAVRAEPFAGLYEQGKIRHVGLFPELEEELCAFSTNGYTGTSSPNRADALVWALASLFPALTAPTTAKNNIVPVMPAANMWAQLHAKR